jgi:hypothetical protein
MTSLGVNDLAEAAKVIEALTGVPLAIAERKMTRKEKREQAARIRRFVALPPELQEGVLRYGENMKEAYLSKSA